MYETYVPGAPEERRPPTIADIVRERTNNGLLIIDFFVAVMHGSIKEAELCHRMDAAKQLVKFGLREAAQFIARYRGIPCEHCERGRPRQVAPRSRTDASPAAEPQNTPGPFTHALLTVLSAVDKDRMARLVRDQTDDGAAVVKFLDDVMQDRIYGFKTYHRMAAARELLVHILRDEHLFAHILHGEHGSHTPSPVGADPRVRPLPGSQSPSPSTLTPSPSTGEGWGEGDSPDPTHTTVAPEKSGLLPQEPSPTQRGGEGRPEPDEEPAHPEPVLSTVEGPVEGSIPNTVTEPKIVRPEPVLSTVEGPVEGSIPNTVIEPKIVRPEPVLSTVEGSVEESIPNTVIEPKIVRPELVEGQCSGDSAVPGPAANEDSQLETNNSKPGTLPRRRRTRRERRQAGNARSAVRRKASTNPGRSPPR